MLQFSRKNNLIPVCLQSYVHYYTILTAMNKMLLSTRSVTFESCQHECYNSFFPSELKAPVWLLRSRYNSLAMSFIYNILLMTSVKIRSLLAS